MATRTLDLPEAPCSQAASRLAADCPCCGAPLRLRQPRQTRALLTGCSTDPSCAVTAPHDPRDGRSRWHVRRASRRGGA